MPQCGHARECKSRNQVEHRLINRNTEMGNSCGSGRLAFGALSCKNIKCTVPSPIVIHSPAEWEDMRRRNRRQRKKKRSKNGGVPVVDIPDVCCTPPGIGSASDVAPRSRIKPPRRNQISHLERRATLPEAVAASSNEHSREFLRSYHQSPLGTSEIVMLHDDPLFGGRLGIFDRERDWSLNVDSIYEQLLEFGHRIGYSSKGLQEEEILGCLTKLKYSTLESDPLLLPHLTFLGCSVCQDEFSRDGEVASLWCGHLYHIDCIKQWLLQQKTCPICRTAAVPGSRVDGAINNLSLLWNGNRYYTT